MLRTGASRALLRSLASPSSLTVRSTHNAAFSKATRVLATSKHPSPTTTLALTKLQPFTTTLQRRATTAKSGVYDHPDHEAEMKIANQPLLPTIEDEVDGDATGSVLAAQAEMEQEQDNAELLDDTDMMAGIRNDLATVKETFALRDVPRQALYIGLAGVLPYLATSLSTIYLAWDINYAHNTGTGFIVSGHTAEVLLHILEPLQVGYGAVIISFLGAIHWGLEFAKYGGHHQGYRRYAIGAVAPAIAWPTMLLPVEYALVTQFLAFVFLYFVDARATVRGWAPAWYSTYRFVLTFIVGASLVVSLIGRGEINDKVGKLPGPADKIRALRDSQWEIWARDEEQERRKIHDAAEAEEGDDDDDE